MITGGAFASTITNLSNVNAGASDATRTQYVSFNDENVEWGGFFIIVPSGSHQQFIFSAALPVAVSFTNNNQLRGAAVAVDSSTYLAGGCQIRARSIDDMMRVQINLSSSTSNPIFVQFQAIYEHIYSGV